VPEPNFAALRAGDVFHGRYTVVRAISAGGMGAVYEVADAVTNTPRALKVMLPGVVQDPDQRARFALEARVTGNIVSDHLIKVSDAGIDEGSGAPFLVMDLLHGEELEGMVERRGPLPPGEVVTYLSQAPLGLEKTHAAGIIHRDLKPQNLFVTTRDDGSPCLKILDFGIAKVVERGKDAQATKTLGTPLYMAPEQIRGDAAIGPRTDLYALGHVAYTLLVGEPYWSEESKTDASLYLMLTKILGGAHELPCARAARRRGIQLPPAFDGWFLSMTAPGPEGRPERAGASIAALAQAFGISGLTAVPSSAQPSRPLPAADPWAATARAITPPSAPMTAPPSTVAAQTAPSPAAMPQPGIAGDPRPMIAAAPQAAPQRKGRWILFAAPAVLASIGAAAAAVLLLAPSGPTACGPDATCVSNDLADPAHVDAQAILPQVKQVALDVDRRAALVGIFVFEGVKDGAADLTSTQFINYQFAIPDATLNLAVHRKQIVITKVKSTNRNTAVVPDPRCSMKSAWKAAVAGGFQARTAASFGYLLWLDGAPVWQISADKSIIHVDAKTCAVRPLKR
jgi:hypothetical protein